METSVIHGLWKLVDTEQSSYLVDLGDSELIQALTSQLVEDRGLNAQEAVQVKSYIGERLLLIRDLARGGF